VLEYLEEGSLSKVLSDFGIIPEKLAAFYIDQVRWAAFFPPTRGSCVLTRYVRVAAQYERRYCEGSPTCMLGG
jgi:hypothetical protein